MDLVVRTPHGDADLTVVSWSNATTVADLVEATTGQVAPPLVHIDDRPVDASTPLDDAPILVGSVVSSHPDRNSWGHVAAVRLQQLTGSGAGTVRALDVGRYRVGPGRRLSADELADASVESPVFELRIDGSSVELAPIEQDAVVLDGRRLTAPAPWVGEHLLAGSRVFTIDRSDADMRRRPTDDADPDGTVQFSRSPQLNPQLNGDESNALVVDAVRRAECADGNLWHQRPGSSRTVVVPFGLLDEQLVEQPMRQISITLEPARPAAIVGPESFSEPLARALLVEAAARYGPADLGIVIATRSERLARWDWAKWLPHLRHGDDIALLSVDAELAEWAASSGASRPERTTLLVLDDADLWSRGDSPWRQLIADPPANVVLLALADRVAGAPAATRTLIVQDPDKRCTLTAVGRAQPLPGILPALVETDLAARFARALAPLRDAELPPDTTTPADATSSITLTEALARFPPPAATVALGTVALGHTAGGRIVDRQFLGGTTCAIEGTDGNDVAGTAMAVILSIVTAQGPTAHPIVLVAPAGRSSLFEVLSRFDFFAGRCNADDPDECLRTRARIEQHLADGGGVTIVVEDAQHHPDVAAQFCELVVGHSQARAISTATIRPDAGSSDRRSDATAADLRITIDRRGGRSRGRVAASSADGTELEGMFEPFEVRTSRPYDALVVRPFVYGRALTTLERQLERSGSGDESSLFGAEIDQLVDRLAHAAGTPVVAVTIDAPRPASLVPDPLPVRVDMAHLLATHEADAVPIGLADNPTQGRHDVVWWQPGVDGSMLFVGGPRSGMDAAIGSIPIGIGERYTPVDVHLNSIDSSNRRLGAVQQLAHTRAAVAPERLDQAAAIVDLLAAEVAARRASGSMYHREDADRPDLLLLIGDLTQLGRRLHDRSYTTTLDNLRLLAAAGDVGVNVVAAVSRASDSCGLIDLVGSVFVAAPHAPTAGAGRCDWSTTGQRVQLATGATTGDTPRSDREP